MKKLVVLFLLTGISISLLEAQVNLGLKAGFHSLELAKDGILVFDENQNEYDLNVDKVNYGFHFGLFLRVGMNDFYVAPALILNSNSADYRLNKPNVANVISVFTEKYKSVDFPLLVGYNAGMVRIFGGPVGHVMITGSSELTDFSSYQQKFDSSTFGWQTGIGIDLLNFGFNISYEGNFESFGNKFVIDGHEFTFDDKPSRILFTVEYRL